MPVAITSPGWIVMPEETVSMRVGISNCEIGIDESHNFKVTLSKGRQERTMSSDVFCSCRNSPFTRVVSFKFFQSICEAAISKNDFSADAGVLLIFLTVYGVWALRH